MVAVAWAAIGLLAATLFGSMYYLGSKIDALGARLDARIDAQGAELSRRIDAQTARIDAQTARIDAQTARIDGLTAQVTDHLRRHVG